MEHLGTQLKEAIKNKGLKVCWVANHLGISRQMLYRNFENGNFYGVRKEKVKALLRK